MQIQKNDIRQTIINIARAEFFANGYQKTSMRIIAKKSEVTLSNIYNYFKNKDEILEIILQPLFTKMDVIYNKHNDPTNINTDWFDIKNVSEMEDFKAHMDMIVEYRQELDLLLHKCSGSKYENIKDVLIDKYTVTSREYLELMKEKYPEVNKDISDFFIHIVAAWWIQILSELVSHNITDEDILKLGKEYTTFGTGGWQRLMNL